MADEDLSCRYCGADIKPSYQRCRECDSWLSWKSFLLYPDTLWTQFGVLVSIAAAVFSWMHAVEARAERAATEAVRRDVTDIAGHVTKMAAVLADGSKRPSGLPEPHRLQIEEYTEALLPHLSVDIKSELTIILRDLNDRVERPSSPSAGTPAPPVVPPRQ